MNNLIEGVVVLGYGTQPLSFIGKASKLCGENAAMDCDVARMAGASFCFGEPQAIDELRERLGLGAFASQARSTPGLSVKATNWLACGSRGISSNTMFTVLIGVDALGGSHGSHPLDPSDLDRCLRLLDSVPELRNRLPMMADVSPQWAALIDNWVEIEQTHLNEVGLGWSKGGRAEKTYALMRAAIESAGKEPV